MKHVPCGVERRYRHFAEDAVWKIESAQTGTRAQRKFVSKNGASYGATFRKRITKCWASTDSINPYISSDRTTGLGSIEVTSFDIDCFLLRSMKSIEEYVVRSKEIIDYLEQHAVDIEE